MVLAWSELIIDIFFFTLDRLLIYGIKIYKVCNVSQYGKLSHFFTNRSIFRHIEHFQVLF